MILLTIEEQDKLKAYADLKRQEKRLKALIEMSAPDVLSILQEKGFDEIEMPQGKFTLAEKRTWEYSEGVSLVSDELKARMKEEEQRGTASYKVSQYLKFYESKSEEAE